MKHLQNTLAGTLCAVQTADSGSFTAAAQVLDLTPAAVSKNVAALEARLQVRLFNRTTRQLTLTDEGRRFVAQARTGLDALALAGASATRDGTPEGLVRLSCAVGFGRRFVLPLLPSFFAAHPRVRVELSLDDRPADLVRDGFDIGIRGGTAPPEGMVARRVCNIPNVLVASPAYLLRAGTPTHWHALLGHALIGLRFLSGKSVAWPFREGRQVFTLEPEGALTLSDPEILLDAALAGLGITQMALHHAWQALDSGALVPVLVQQHAGTPIALSVFYPHRQGLAPRVRVLVDHLLATWATDETLQADRSALQRFVPTPTRRAR